MKNTRSRRGYAGLLGTHQNNPLISPPTMDPRILDLRALMTAQLAFAERVRLAPDVPLAVPDTHLHWEDLQAAVDAVTGEYGHGVVIFLGLHDTTIRYGLSVVAWTAAGPDIRPFVQPEHPDFLVQGGHLVPTTPAEWEPLRNAYLEQVLVERSSEFEHLNALDARCITQAWEDQLLAMHEQNAPYGEAPLLTFTNIALHYDGSDGGNAGYRHQVALNMAVTDEGTVIELVNDHPYSAPMRMKATDRGNGCPPTCGTYLMPK